jgi:hypothetical protein
MCMYIYNNKVFVDVVDDFACSKPQLIGISNCHV